MKCYITDLDKLLHILIEKAGQSMDRAGFGIISQETDVPQKYIYDLHRKIVVSTKNGVSSVELHVKHLDKLCDHLKFKSYHEFTKSIQKPIDPIIESCIGSYYCYLRRNSTAPAIFRSPAKVERFDGKVFLELKGPKWNYRGEIALKHGCLFILLETAGGKQFHHIYKIGLRESPEVLQGIFSGVSTSFDPIGGRVVLIKRNEAFEKLTNLQLELPHVSGDLTEKRVVEYFSTYHDNNLSIKSVTSFTIDDLGVTN